MKRRVISLIYVTLATGIIVSALSLYGIVTDIREDARRRESEFRDDIVWYTSQFKMELEALIDTVVRIEAGDSGIAPGEVVDRFDVLWSRLQAAGHGPLGRAFMQLEGAPRSVSRAQAMLHELEPRLAELGPSKHAATARIAPALRSLRADFHELALAALRSRQTVMRASAARQDERTWEVMVFFAGVLVLGMALFALLVFERAKVNTLRRGLEKQFEERTRELRETGQRYRTLVENAPEAIIVFDVQLGHFVDANENAARLFKRTREELLRLGPQDLSPELQPDGRSSGQSGRDYVERAVAGETPVFEWTHCDAEGNPLSCEVRLVRLPASNATLVRGSVTDIGARKRVESELAEYRENLEGLIEKRTRELEDAQRELVRSERLAAIGQLIGTVSHELRNPLGTIKNSFAVLRQRVDDEDPIVSRNFERIGRSTDRCDRIIDELLDYTRARPPDLEQVNIDEWLRSITTEQDFPEELAVTWDLQAAARIRLDKERARQAVINLVQNAFQSITEQRIPGRAAKITISTRVASGRVEIHLSDNGPGVPPELRERIFDPLFSTRSFGIGLGLPLVRQIAEQHGGGVEVGDAPCGGAEFVLWFPLPA